MVASLEVARFDWLLVVQDDGDAEAGPVAQTAAALPGPSQPDQRRGAEERRAAKAAAAKQRAELELLLMDDTALVTGAGPRLGSVRADDEAEGTRRGKMSRKQRRRAEVRRRRMVPNGSAIGAVRWLPINKRIKPSAPVNKHRGGRRASWHAIPRCCSVELHALCVP